MASTVRKYLKVQYLAEKMKLQSKLEKQDAVGLTSDFWTSNKNQSYITTTAHYIDTSWILRSTVLATRRLVGQHTGQFISSALDDIRQEFNIHSKVSGLTTDNASNMKKAASMQIYNTVSTAPIGCTAHTLQLAVDGALEATPIQKAAAEARKCVALSNGSTKTNDALEDYQIRQGQDSKALTLIQDIATRWNSLYFMIKKLLHLRAAVYAVLHDRKIMKPNECVDYEISNESWIVMESLLPVLKQLGDATEALSYESYPSISGTIPMVTGLIRNDLAAKEDDTVIVKEFKAKVIAGLQSRITMPTAEGYLQSALAKTTFLDPRHKCMAFIDDQTINSRLKISFWT